MQKMKQTISNDVRHKWVSLPVQSEYRYECRFLVVYTGPDTDTSFMLHPQPSKTLGQSSRDSNKNVFIFLNFLIFNF